MLNLEEHCNVFNELFYQLVRIIYGLPLKVGLKLNCLLSWKDEKRSGPFNIFNKGQQRFSRNSTPCLVLRRGLLFGSGYCLVHLRCLGLELLLKASANATPLWASDSGSESLHSVRERHKKNPISCFLFWFACAGEVWSKYSAQQKARLFHMEGSNVSALVLFWLGKWSARQVCSCSTSPTPRFLKITEFGGINYQTANI